MRVTKFGHSQRLEPLGERARVQQHPGTVSLHQQARPNVGYLVGGRLFHPGDALTMPGESVQVLAVPAGAPWLKLAEAVDYLREVAPRVAVPVHEKVLSEAGISFHYRQLEQLAGRGTAFRVLDDGRPVEL
jgi:L-ascorbate metabolism protein UlaG (beta-lactamase superfamily)